MFAAREADVNTIAFFTFPELSNEMIKMSLKSPLVESRISPILIERAAENEPSFWA
jgi:hypothetical protein